MAYDQGLIAHNYKEFTLIILIPNYGPYYCSSKGVSFECGLITLIYSNTAIISNSSLYHYKSVSYLHVHK